MSRRLRKRYGRRHQFGHSKSMTWGVLPPYKEFVHHIHTAIDPDYDRPYLPKGETFTIQAHAGTEDDRVLRRLRIEPVGSGEYGKLRWELTPRQVYSVIKRAANMNMSNMRDEELREAAGSLASSMMTVLGYEWI